MEVVKTFLVLFAVFFCIFIFNKIRLFISNKVKKKKQKYSVMIVLGSGGHTSELLQLCHTLPSYYNPRTYVIADTDKRSIAKVKDYETSKNNYKVVKVKRSREVGQSWFSTVFSTLVAIYESVIILLTYKTDLLFCNGPGTCIPICLVSSLLRLFYLNNTRVVFIESICRVKTLSLSGKIMYYLADKFIVQWPELSARYPMSVYLGNII